MDLFRESVWKGIILQARAEGTYFAGVQYALYAYTL